MPLIISGAFLLFLLDRALCVTLGALVADFVSVYFLGGAISRADLRLNSLFLVNGKQLPLRTKR
jgi:hypothetical protein